MTDADRWQRISALFDEAADLPLADRPAFLDGACRAPDGRSDAALREEVERLLALDLAAETHAGGLADRLTPAGLAEPVPERVGPWRLVREVGRGGMGTVHLAERDDGRFHQTAAVKLVRPGLAPGLVARFRAERQILARLDHPAIARLLDGGRTDDAPGQPGRPYLVMEFVDGEPITAYCDRRRLGVNERLALFQSVCEAVHVAHQSLVVHRDLKPSNVLVAEGADGAARVKLLDFGIAKLLAEAGDDESRVETATEQRVMTPEYAAPEQVRGEAVTTATDVYALGVLLYELLTGRRPHGGAGGRHAVERAILDTEPARPSEAVTESAPTGGRVPPDPSQQPGAPPTGGTGELRSTTADRLRRRLRGDLDRIVLKALRKEPERRYEGAAALGADVRRHLAGLPVEARPDTAGYRVSKFVRRHRGATAGLALALVALVAGAGVALWQAAEARTERDRAEAAAEEAAATSDFLVGLFESSDPTVAQGDSLLAHDLVARGVADASALRGQPLLQGRLLTTLGVVYENLGRYADGERVLARADSALALAQPDGGRDRARALRHHAVALKNLSRLDEAGPRYLAAEAMTRAHVPPGDLDLVRVANDYAAYLGQSGEYERADSIFAAALAEASVPGARAERRERAELVALVLHNRGNGLNRLGRYREAGRSLGRALALRRRVLGDRHPHTISTLQNLARVRQLSGDLDAAEPLYREVLDAQREVYGASHPAISGLLSDLALVQQKRGAYDDAGRLYREAIAMAEADGGPAASLITRNNLGTLFLARGDLDGAERQFREVLAERRPLFGDRHLWTAQSYGSLARVDEARGDLAAAERRYRDAADILGDVLPPEHPVRLVTDARLGRVLVARGQAAEGARLLRSALAGLQAAVGPEHEYTREATEAVRGL